MTKNRLLILFSVLCSFFMASTAPALTLEPALSNPVQEARAQEIFKQIRCVVCTSESIHDSNAGLAKDFRERIRERITAGDTDQQVLDYMVARYGDYILMEPPVKETTYLLWYGPILILLLGGTGIAAMVWKRRKKL